tara:strand:- start:188 stop:484 length:297 start_codon:yes stop_codon:yes gene_type:complete
VLIRQLRTSAPPNQQSIYPTKSMQKTTDEVVFLLITIILIVVDALQTILSIRTKGILIDQRQLLLQKTNKDLRGMLKGIPKTNKMKKAELVELVLIHA